MNPLIECVEEDQQRNLVGKVKAAHETSVMMIDAALMREIMAILPLLYSPLKVFFFPFVFLKILNVMAR